MPVPMRVGVIVLVLWALIAAPAGARSREVARGAPDIGPFVAGPRVVWGDVTARDRDADSLLGRALVMKHGTPGRRPQSLWRLPPPGGYRYLSVGRADASQESIAVEVFSGSTLERESVGDNQSVNHLLIARGDLLGGPLGPRPDPLAGFQGESRCDETNAILGLDLDGTRLLTAEVPCRGEYALRGTLVVRTLGTPQTHRLEPLVNVNVTDVDIAYPYIAARVLNPSGASALSVIDVRTNVVAYRVPIAVSQFSLTSDGTLVVRSGDKGSRPGYFSVAEPRHHDLSRTLGSVSPRGLIAAHGRVAAMARGRRGRDRLVVAPIDPNARRRTILDERRGFVVDRFDFDGSRIAFSGRTRSRRSRILVDRLPNAFPRGA